MTERAIPVWTCARCGYENYTDRPKCNGCLRPKVVGRDEDYRLTLLRAVVAYDAANQSDLPLGLLDAIRAEVATS